MQSLKPKLYLDTNHLINIAKLRKGILHNCPDKHAAYATLNKQIANGHLGLVLDSTSALEWVDGNATLSSAFEIADVIDSAPLQYEIEFDTFVFLYEVLQECKRTNENLRIPEFSILHNRLMERSVRRAYPVVVNEVPGWLDPVVSNLAKDRSPVEISFETAREWVKQVWRFKAERPSVYHERVAGHNAAYQHDLDEFETRKTKEIQESDRFHWMKRFLRVDHILATLNPTVNVDQILHGIDIERCPAANLFFRAHEKRIRAGHPTKENDVDDWAFLSVVPYCDVVVTERNLRSFLHQADSGLRSKVTHDPIEAVKLLQKWL